MKGKTKYIIFIINFIILLIILSFLAYFLKNINSNETNLESSNITPATQQFLSLLRQAIDKTEHQKVIETSLRQEFENNIYTFDNPFIILDPYNESPLSALILFKTEHPSKISITIQGKDKYTEVNHAFSELSDQHILPIYGLYPDFNNKILLKQFSENNELIAENTINIRTEPLPSRLNNLIILTESYKENYESDLNYHFYRDKFAFDKNGDIRWFLSNEALACYDHLSNSNEKFILAPDCPSENKVILYEIDKLGKIYNLYYSQYGIHHDITRLPNGNLIVLGSQGETVEDFVYEIDTSTGLITNYLDFKKILQRTRFHMGNPDWLHANSIVYDENDNTIIISSNSQSTIAKVTWPEGKIKWILASPEHYMPQLQKYLLQPIGNSFEYSYNHHDINILPDYDNNPNTIDISVFDNGTNRNISNNNSNYSRLVHYRINENDMTVEQIWQYGKERGTELFSYNMSSFKILPLGNRLGTFMTSQQESIGSPKIIEVDSNSELVWDAEIFSKSETGSSWVYQVRRYPFYSENDTEHDISRTINNLIPEDVFNTYVPLINLK